MASTNEAVGSMKSRFRSLRVLGNCKKKQSSEEALTSPDLCRRCAAIDLRSDALESKVKQCGKDLRNDISGIWPMAAIKGLTPQSCRFSWLIYET
jgi:hypothetical protein